MTKVKKLKIIPFSIFQAKLMMLVGLIAGIIYSFGGLVIDVLVSLELASSSTMDTPGLSYGTILAFGALIGMPVVFVVFGFILGLVEAILFNIFSKWFGGINIDF